MALGHFTNNRGEPRYLHHLIIRYFIIIISITITGRVKIVRKLTHSRDNHQHQQPYESRQLEAPEFTTRKRFYLNMPRAWTELDGSDRKRLVEPMIPGEYVKMNSNAQPAATASWLEKLCHGSSKRSCSCYSRTSSDSSGSSKVLL